MSKNNTKAFIINNYGFTLVELMVVVAIIGILSAVAIPNFQKYQSKARQTEAKLALAGIYTAEKAFSAENGSYTACLKQAGFVPDGSTSVTNLSRYYTVGFQNSVVTASSCGTVTLVACKTYNFSAGTTCTTGTVSFTNSLSTMDTAYAAQARINATANPGDGALTSSLVSSSTFTAAAAGSITGSSTTLDGWTMDQDKSLSNTTSGI